MTTFGSSGSLSTNETFILTTRRISLGATVSAGSAVFTQPLLQTVKQRAFLLLFIVIFLEQKYPHLSAKCFLADRTNGRAYYA